CRKCSSGSTGPTRHAPVIARAPGWAWPFAIQSSGLWAGRYSGKQLGRGYDGTCRPAARRSRRLYDTPVRSVVRIGDGHLPANSRSIRLPLSSAGSPSGSRQLARRTVRIVRVDRRKSNCSAFLAPTHAVTVAQRSSDDRPAIIRTGGHLSFPTACLTEFRLLSRHYQLVANRL